MSERIFATLDSDGGVIAEGAEISKFKSRAEAVECLLKSYPKEDYDHSTAVIEAGDYSDCWAKFYDTPKATWVAPFRLCDMMIHHPGFHPGGNEYWVTPRPKVLVVSSIAARS